MSRVLLLLALASTVQAGVIQGIVLEHLTGRAVSRTWVRLQSVRQPGMVEPTPLAIRSGLSGQFSFGGIPPGLYLLTATRDGFFPASYGQRTAVSRGVPIRVAEDSTLFAELRLRRKGAITGRVLDENGVGAPGVPVIAYRARQPLRAANTALSDDRGVYRVHGLDPGKYFVRTGGHILEDKSMWVATFGPSGRELRDAAVHSVTVDTDTMYADINPQPGALYTLAGAVTCGVPGEVIVTAMSDSVTVRARTKCEREAGGYAFSGLTPGFYEVFATLEDGSLAAALDTQLYRDIKNADLSLGPPIPVTFRINDPNVQVKFLVRRRGTAESEPWLEVKGKVTTLGPGYWEVRGKAPAGYYVATIGDSVWARMRRADPPTETYVIHIPPTGQQTVPVSVQSDPGRVDGSALTDKSPTPGVAVFLWPVDDSVRRSAGGVLQTLTDTEGRFAFENLPPGKYRVVASAEFYEVDADVMEAVHAQEIVIKSGGRVSVDLPVWTGP